MMKCDVN